MNNIILYVFCLFFFIDAGLKTEDSSEKIHAEIIVNSQINRLAIPDRVITLPDELMEISDIAMIDNETLAGIQDEEGAIYIIKISDGNIISKHKFAGNADFEGLAITGNTAYAVTSNGVIYIVKDYKKATPEVSKHATRLTELNNVEGLYHDIENNQLLLLCKNAPGNNLDEKLFKGVYSFDLKTKKLQDKVFLEISLEKIKDFIRKTDNTTFEKMKFNPSAITVHPVKKTYFILASSGKLLVEMDHAGNVIDVKKLDKKIFNQPEGIAFDKNEDMYISNEGDVDLKANIMLFKK